MTGAEPTILHDDDPGTPHAWQRCGTLAAALGIAERTVRARALRGDVERMRTPGGAVYFRAPMPSTGNQRHPDVSDPAAADEIARLRSALVEAHRERATEIGQLRERLQVAAVAAAESTVLAEVATRDAERAQAHAEALAAELSTERLRRATVARYAAALSAAPWYAWRRRRAIRAHLDGVELVGLPGAS